MRSTAAALAILTLLSLGLVVPVAFSSTGDILSGLSPAVPGFAAYTVQIQSHGQTRAFTFNESVRATQTQGKDLLTLAIASQHGNLTYTRIVNSSDFLQPFVPAISNQSLNLEYNSTSISLHLAQDETTSLTFQGTAYQMTAYSFSAAVKSANFSGTDVGSFSTFPSGLVYSLDSNINGSTTVNATLTATSLPLSSASASPQLQVESVGIGAAAVGGLLLATLGVRSRRRARQEAPQKPDYWVD